MNDTNADIQVNASVPPANSIASRMATLNAIKSKFITTVINMYVNSLGREVGFREITVAEQKKLARIMIDNENRRDIVYDAQCAILKAICLEDSIDIYKLTEFDKIKLLLLMYQRNMMKHEISFICPECPSENKYKIDFNNVLHRLDSFDIGDKVFEYDNGVWNFKFTIGYPLVSKVSDYYHRQYAKAKQLTDKKSFEAFNTSVNVDYVNLFIKKMEFTDAASGETTSIDTSDYSIDEIFDVISVFPQDVMYSENGVISYITDNFISRINDTFDKHRCTVCNALCSSLSD